MRKVLFFFAIAGSLAACQSNDSKVASMSAGDSTKHQEDVTYAYPIMYSAKFENGDPKNGKTILDLWKAWDDGKIGVAQNLFADSVNLYFWDGTNVKGPRDSVLAIAQKVRDNLASAKSTVYAVHSLKSTDKNEDWVTV